jgi:hypothetical protein
MRRPIPFRFHLVAILLSASFLVPSAASGEEPIAERYRADLEELERTRLRAADALRAARGWKERAAVLESARRELLAALTGKLIPAWFGTRWAFYGTSETPGEGTIACGYFVTTVLRDAGLRIERVKLAQQASERIVQTLVPKQRIVRFSNLRPAEVVAALRAREGEGLYVVGLDYHVGFLHLGPDEARFCHSAFLEPVAVLCEPAAESAGLVSGYTVAGKLLSESMLEAWLDGRAIRTRAASGGSAEGR